MTKRIAIFTHICPYPPNFGFLKRVMSIISGLKSLGVEIHLFSPKRNNLVPWAKDNFSYLLNNYVNEINLHHSSLPSHLFWGALRRATRLAGINHSSVFRFFTPPKMVSWFNNQIEKLEPDAIMINYAHFDGLVDHKKFQDVQRIIDTIDLYSLNQNMQSSLRKYLPKAPINPKHVNELILQEDFYNSNPARMDPHEFRIFDRYSDTITISRREAEIILDKTQNTRVTFIPMMHEIHEIVNEYTGPPLFLTGPNLFNVQGYLYFVRRVLPKVMDQQPDFVLNVTGFIDKTQVVPQEGIRQLGFVPDLDPLFRQSRFAISPVFGGTGQQIKIIEAMAYGLPVVILKELADRSPVENGVNGYIANCADEFADYVCTLWSDRALCHKLGQEAKQTVKENFSHQQLIDRLSNMMI